MTGSGQATAMGTVTGRWIPSALLVGTAVAAGMVLMRRSRSTGEALGEPHLGTSSNGMEYSVIGTGPKNLLHLQGGPGSAIQGGWLGKFLADTRRPYLATGFRFWDVTRRRHMPTGHSVADMADDYAQFIREHLAGHADLVYGVSYGGMVAIYLAANHPELVGRVVLAFSGATAVGGELDHEISTAVAEGRLADAGAASLVLVFPGERWRTVRRALAPLVGRLLAAMKVPPGDLLVERDAEETYDARNVLGRIKAPVLILSAERDEFFPPEIVAETAASIANCTVITYRRLTHAQGAASNRPIRDVLAWLGS